MRFVDVSSRSAQAAAAQVLLLLLRVVLSASEVVRLSCDVTDLPGGLVQYRLSPEPGPDCWGQGWEDHNKTALTRESSTSDLVHSLTNDTLVLKSCLSHVRFIAQCSLFVEANCSFDCSSVPRDSVKPIKLCLGGSCVDTTLVAVTSVAVLLCVGLGVLLGLWCFYKYKKRSGHRDLRRRAEELDLSRKDQVNLLLQERVDDQPHKDQADLLLKPLGDSVPPSAVQVE